MIEIHNIHVHIDDAHSDVYLYIDNVHSDRVPEGPHPVVLTGMIV